MYECATVQITYLTLLGSNMALQYASTGLRYSSSSDIRFRISLINALSKPFHTLILCRGGLLFLAMNAAPFCCAFYRVCMVNNDGGVLLDHYVRPAEKVTDYRTFVSGIEPVHLKEGAISLSQAQKQVAQMLTDRVLVGHAVHHDLQVKRQIGIFVV